MIDLEKLKAEIEQFKAEAMKMHFVQVWAESYQNTDPFDHMVDEVRGVFWLKAQAYQLWKFWQFAKQTKQAEIEQLRTQLKQSEIVADQLLTERDEYQNLAEKLKDRLQNTFNQDFGEHSNANCPFNNALEFNYSRFMVVPKDKLHIFWQDDDEPENFCNSEANFNCLGDGLQINDIIVINKYHQAEIKTEKLYGTWFTEATDPSQRANFHVGTYGECLEIVAKNKAMIKASEVSE